MADRQRIVVDGSYGEGGGQILRSSLSLSAVTGRPFTITNIRANRKPPGLRPQHLLSVTSAGQVCGAKIEGAEIGARQIAFDPDRPRPGVYRFDVGTAGAASLVLQTIFFPLALAGAESSVAITGGTHIPWSPSWHYLEWHWLPALRRIGFDADISMRKAGFYPQGGGEIRAAVRPHRGLHGLRMEKLGLLKRIRGLSAIANLPDHIAERQRGRALARLKEKGMGADIEIVRMPSPGKGTILLLLAEFEGGTSCHYALGAIGKRAETVADEACGELFDFLAAEAAVEHHFADQALIPLALAPDDSFFTTSKVTSHLVTNAWVIERFTDVKIRIEGEEGRRGKVWVTHEA